MRSAACQADSGNAPTCMSQGFTEVTNRQEGCGGKLQTSSEPARSDSNSKLLTVMWKAESTVLPCNDVIQHLLLLSHCHGEDLSEEKKKKSCKSHDLKCKFFQDIQLYSSP
ncbi:LOW QUALITY PROTEIN: hypothetical protein Nmel_009107 [Mimus melanotis]